MHRPTPTTARGFGPLPQAPSVHLADGFGEDRSEAETEDHAMTDEERELAIKDASKALEDAQAHYERCKAVYAESGCFGHAADVDQADDARHEARRYMEALIRGRSPAMVRHMERTLGIV